MKTLLSLKPQTLWFLSLIMPTALHGQNLRIVDPEQGAYLSGDYEIILATDIANQVKRTRLWIDGQVAFEAEGWHERIRVDLGEDILRRVVVAEIETMENDLVRSGTVTTRALEIDYRDTTRLVLVGAVVKTRGNRHITGLEASQFTVLENGLPLEIQTLYKEQLPLDLVLLLDTSSSLRDGGLEDLKRAAVTFIGNLAPGDRVALYEFKKKPRKVQDFTTNRRQLIQHIQALEAIGETALFNALHLGLDGFSSGRKGRKAILLFTDGRDSYYDDARDKARVMREAIVKAQNQEVTMFTLGLGKRIHKGALERMAEDSGGRFYYADNPSRLPRVFEDIVADLKNQYILAVVPKATGKGFQRLEVKVSRRGARVYARKGYTLQ